MPISTNLLSGEYVKDIDFELLPQDPLLDDKFPRPLVERGYCYGIFDPVGSCFVYYKNMLYNKSLRSYSDVVVGKLEATLNISH